MKTAALLFFALFSAFCFQACRSTKIITTAISKKDTSSIITVNPEPIKTTDSVNLTSVILQKINANNIDCQWFFAKMKVDYDDNSGQNNDATAYVHLRKDSLIWISLTGTLGIEGFRVLITQDSIKVMNKLKKTIQYRSISYLKELTQLPFDFATMQDFILGNPVYFSNHIVSYRQSNNQIQALAVGQLFKHLITIDTATNQILHSKLDDADPQKSRTCDITFANYENNQGRIFAADRDVTVTEKSKLDIHLRFKQVMFDQPQGFPFTVPKSYKIN